MGQFIRYMLEALLTNWTLARFPKWAKCITTCMRKTLVPHMCLAKKNNYWPWLKWGVLYHQKSIVEMSSRDGFFKVLCEQNMCLRPIRTGTVPRRKCQMDHVCHKNKCCQSNSPKQYKNTDLFTQKEYSWPHWSHSNSSLLFFLLLWNQCYQDCCFWVKNQCYYITFLSNFGNIYFCDKHDPFDVCDAARYCVQKNRLE